MNGRHLHNIQPIDRVEIKMKCRLIFLLFVLVVVGADIKANIYAPNGTLSIGYNAKMRGAFIARDIAVGSRASVWHESAF